MTRPSRKRTLSGALLVTAVVAWVLTPFIFLFKLTGKAKIILIILATIAGEGSFLVAMVLGGKLYLRYGRRKAFVLFKNLRRRTANK